MDNIKEHTMGSCYIRIFNIFCSQLKRNLCIDSHTETNGNCINKVLYRKDQRQSCHRLLTDLCHKKLSTMLYSEFTSIDSTIGIAIDARSGRIGFSS